MIEESGLVVQIDVDGTWVETQRRSTCSSCSAQNGCGTSVLAKVLGTRRSKFRVLSDVSLQVGDPVIVGIREQSLVRGSLAVYAVPLLMLLVGASLGELGAEQNLWQDAEQASVLLGLSGLAGGLYWLKRFSVRIQNDRKYQPVVLRRGIAVTEQRFEVK